MFLLIEVEESVKVEPQYFGKDSECKAIGVELNKKYANHILPELGLGVTIFDVLSVGDGLVFPGEGRYYAKVNCRILVFSPSVGEIITGKIRKCLPEGIRISVGDFFGDVYIPAYRLQTPNNFKEEEECWVWKYEDDKGKEFELEMNVDDEIRFRVEKVQFFATSPQKMQTAKDKPANDVWPELMDSRPPMLIYVSYHTIFHSC